jgi:putative peptidoglycan lipid II flippase
MDEGIGLAMALTLPAAASLLIAPVFLIDAFFARGEFTTFDALQSGNALFHFAWGVPAFVLARVFTPPYFARHRARQPMQFSIVAVVVNTAMGATLWFWLPTVGIDGAIGLAIATSTAGWINVTLLAGTLARENVYRLGPAVLRRMLRLLGASAVMAGFIAVCAWQYPLLADLFWRKEVAVMLVAAAGFGIYAASAIALGAVTPAEIRSSLRRERGAPDAHQGLPGGSEG